MVPRPHQFLIVPADIPAEGSRVEVCFRQALHPICLLPLSPALAAGREAEGGRIRGSQSASAAQPSPTHGSTQELHEPLALGPAPFWE